MLSVMLYVLYLWVLYKMLAMEARVDFKSGLRTAAEASENKAPKFPGLATEEKCFFPFFLISNGWTLLYNLRAHKNGRLEEKRVTT